VPPETRDTATPAPKQRDPWFDNAKMALVTLVVVGHAWVLLPETFLSDPLYDFLYAWHVPAFVFVTGYLSRTFQWDKVPRCGCGGWSARSSSPTSSSRR
jgi:fucose 4-O-acetylase-like acetyltransferase